MFIIRKCHGCGKPVTGGASRCIGCRIIRRQADKEQKRQAAEAALTPTTRTKLLTLLRNGVPLGEACASLGVSTAAVHGFRAYDPVWSVNLDAALLEGRDPSLKHPSAMAYRWGRCRCSDCRRWKEQSRRRIPR